jgi:hypothetical protein
MPALTKLYERHAKDCARAADLTDDPKRREQFMKLAYEWAQAAAVLRASKKSAPQRRGSRARSRHAARGPKPPASHRASS